MQKLNLGFEDETTLPTKGRQPWLHPKALTIAVAVGTFAVACLLTAGHTPVQRYIVEPMAFAPNAQRVPLPQRTIPRFRIDPDDVIDVDAEVVDVTDGSQSRKPASKAKPPPRDPSQGQARGPQAFYQQTMYDERQTERLREMFGPNFINLEEFNQPPWWASLLPLVPAILGGVLLLVVVGCVATGFLGWIFSFLGCLILVNAISGLLFGGGDDNDDLDFPQRGRRRDPWL